MVREHEQKFGNNVFGWVERDENGDPNLMLRIKLKWDKISLTKKGFPAIASTHGRQRILEHDENGIMSARDEWISFAVWIGKKKGYVQ